ncbi:MAG: hypothetical protein LLG04_15135, partial [Parachlamydia sp.]|nr:hypothetical protein [Parachlamydia sp.]
MSTALPFAFFSFNSHPVRPDNALKCSVKRGSLPIASAASVIQEMGRHLPVNALDFLLTDEEISTYSLIRKPNAAQVKQQLDALAGDIQHASLHSDIVSIAVNFLGSGIVTGDDKLDGFPSVSNYAIWLWLIQDLISKTEAHTAEALILSNLTEGLEKLKTHAADMRRLSQRNSTDKERYDAALKFAQRLHNLKSDEAEPFSGGYLNGSAANS